MSDIRFEIIKKRPFAASVAALMALLLGYLLLWPVPFDPCAGRPRRQSGRQWHIRQKQKIGGGRHVGNRYQP